MDHSGLSNVVFGNVKKVDTSSDILKCAASECNMWNKQLCKCRN